MVSKETLQSLRLEEPVDLSSIKVYYMEDDGGFITTPVSNEVRAALRKSVQFLSEKFKVPTTRVNLRYMKYSLPFWFGLINHSAMPVDEFMANCQGRVNLWLELLKTLIRRSNHTFACLFFLFLQKLVLKLGSGFRRTVFAMSQELKVKHAKGDKMRPKHNHAPLIYMYL